MTNVSVAWVRPPQPIRGLDHLGVQAPCTAIFSYLLPGLTNVTERARYYSFHPWVLWAFEQHVKERSLAAFQRVLRRAECLFALAAIRHSRAVEDSNERRHGARMVGRQELMRIPEDAEQIFLEEFAALDGSHRYFKNRNGGLGQYYFGPLRDMQILDRSPEGSAVPYGYDRERGTLLAEAFSRGVPEQAFFDLVAADEITWDDLDALAPFCPCALRQSPIEHETLIQLFFARTSAFQAGAGETRRASLGLMLDLVGREAHPDGYSFESLLRGAAYAGALPDGSEWLVAPFFRQAQAGWRIYQQNELLSIALQGLFSAVLRAIERDEGGVLRSVRDAGRVAERLVGRSALDLSLPLTTAITTTRERLPNLREWQNEGHELQRAWEVVDLGRDPTNEQLQQLVALSLEILLALLARGIDEDPYAEIERDAESFDPREIHLASFRHASRTVWSSMTVGEWVRWLAVEWGVNRHLRVALRKLRGEQRDTFRIRPLEQQLRVVEVPPPTLTMPRVGSSEQILLDLDLVDLRDDKLVLTDRGRRELEACRGE